MSAIHPGEILQEEFLEPLGLSVDGLATAIGVPAEEVLAIVKNQRGITADTALRLARYFGNTPQFWMNLQQNYELARARIRPGNGECPVCHTLAPVFRPNPDWDTAVYFWKLGIYYVTPMPKSRRVDCEFCGCTFRQFAERD